MLVVHASTLNKTYLFIITILSEHFFIYYYHTLGTFPNSNRKIRERDKIDTLDNKCMAAHISCLGSGTSRKVGEVKLVLWGQTPS